MELVKAQRLSQNLAVVSDMVSYADISAHLVESKVVSPEENQSLWGKLAVEGNVMVMNELLTMVTLRHGGFDALTQALRKFDYAWLAEQLDPGKIFSNGNGTCPTPGGREGPGPVQKRIVSAITRRISRRGEARMSSRPTSRSSYGNGEGQDNDMLFMSYRDECPMDIPINPSYYAKTGCRDSYQAEAASVPLQKSEDNDGDEADAFKILNLNGNSSSSIMTPSSQAVIYNLPPSHLQNAHVEEYLTTLAKRAHVPSPMIQDLKVLHPSSTSKISKKKGPPKLKKNTLHLQFNSETGRNAFVEQMNSFIRNMKPNDDLYSTVSQMKVAIIPPNKKKKMGRGRRLLFLGGSTQEGEEETSSKQGNKTNWYQRPFRFQSWKKQKS